MGHAEAIEEHRRKIVALLKTLTTGEGLRPSALDGVKLSRADRDYPRSPVLYEPSIFIVVSGRKHGYFGKKHIIYDQSNYLVLSLPLPFDCRTEVGPRGEPMLGVSIRVDMSTLSELALEVGIKRKGQMVDAYQVVGSTPVDVPLTSAVLRLLEAMESAQELKVLGQAIRREIVYRVLCGPQGEALLALLSRNAPLSQLHFVLRCLHTDYAKPLDVSSLSEQAGMSISSFHHTFKAVTTTSPMQYLKRIRLHKARMLMVHDGRRAAMAAAAVGYESASQFSREFKRYFGQTPIEEVERVRSVMGLDLDGGLAMD